MATSKCTVTRWEAGNECQLTATEFIPEGGEILREKPLVAVPVGAYAFGTYTWELVDRVLSDPRVRDIYYSWRLKRSDFFTDPTDLDIEKRLAKKYNLPRPVIKALYFSIATNNIAHIDNGRAIRGYGLYQVLSRANHSCNPSTDLTPGDVQAGELVLVARHDIEAGEAVTWDYFSDVSVDGIPFTELDYETRNFNLVNAFGFVCRCEKCRTEQPDTLKGIDQLKYFHDLIWKQAQEVIAQEMAVNKSNHLATAFSKTRPLK